MQTSYNIEFTNELTELAISKVVSPPTDGVSYLDFSPQQEYLAAASWDNQVIIYESILYIYSYTMNRYVFMKFYKQAVQWLK